MRYELGVVAVIAGKMEVVLTLESVVFETAAVAVAVVVVGFVVVVVEVVEVVEVEVGDADDVDVGEVESVSFVYAALFEVVETC